MFETSRPAGRQCGVRSLVGGVQAARRFSALRAQVKRKAAENGGEQIKVGFIVARARAHCMGRSGS